MPEPFKNFFNRPLIEKMAQSLAGQTKMFDAGRFISLACDNLEALELKQRSNQIRDALLATLPDDIEQIGPALVASLGVEASIDGVTQGTQEEGISGFAIMPLADFVAEIGIEHPEQSLDVLAEVTKRFSSEFAVRPFIIAHPDITMRRFLSWTKSSNAHVRRLASEGCRPLLPWGIRLKEFVADPAPILPLLEQLKDDDTEYVRRSVANNLNDIAKNHPDLIAQIATKWLKGANKNRTRLVRHACRTLIKQGHQPTLKALGYAEFNGEFKAFHLKSNDITLGEALEFSFVLQSNSANNQPLIVDYAIHFKKANGSTAPKIFKLKTSTLAGGQMLEVEKAHKLKKITTMKFYEGEQKIELLVNGKSLASLPFTLRTSDE